MDIVVVNWNSGRQLEECIWSIRQHRNSRVEKIIVVDNGSSDGSTKFLMGAADVDLISNSKNLGFGRACNLGASHGNSVSILFLNPDARLLSGSLDVPLDFLSHPEQEQIGIVGISLVGEDGAVQRTCARFPTLANMLAKSFGISAIAPRYDMLMKTWDHSESRIVDQVIGAFFLVRRSLFVELDGFDERYFVYFEEVDFSRRAALAGYSTVYLTSAQAYHKGGGVSEQVKAHRLFYSLRSRIQYAYKHFNRPAASAVGFATVAVEPLSRFAFCMVKGRFEDIRNLWSGYYMLWVWIITGGAPRS
jgi:GT2 family glycosyltransferase